MELHGYKPPDLLLRICYERCQSFMYMRGIPAWSVMQAEVNSKYGVCGLKRLDQATQAA